MGTVRAWVVEQPGPVGSTRPLRLVTRDDPLPAAGQIRVAVRACGVCRTDVHIRDGYFDGDVAIVVKPAGRPEWVDLEVLVHLGHWYRISEVEGHGNTALSDKDLLSEFGPRWYQLGWLGRLRLDRFRDDAASAEGLTVENPNARS